MWADNVLLGAHLESWYELMARHQASISNLQYRLEREHEGMAALQHKIRQGLELLKDNGSIKDPKRFKLVFLDMYYYRLGAPKKMKTMTAAQFRNSFRQPNP